MEYDHKQIVELQVRDFNDSRSILPFTLDIEFIGGYMNESGQNKIQKLVDNGLIKKVSKYKHFPKSMYSVLIKTYGKHKNNLYVASDDSKIIYNKIIDAVKIAEPKTKLI